MKYSLLGLSLLALSCGKIDLSTSSSGIGTVKQLQTASISTGDHLVFDSICQALVQKGQKLSLSQPSGMTFDVVQKDCDGNNVVFDSQVVRVENSSGYRFVNQTTNAAFVFPEVETSTSGIMKEICGGASSLPIISGSEAKTVSASGLSSADCPTASGERCLVVEYGTKVEGTTNSYKIYKKEFVRFNTVTTSGKYGYFTYRKSFSGSVCDQNKSVESQVTLR